MAKLYKIYLIKRQYGDEHIYHEELVRSKSLLEAVEHVEEYIKDSAGYEDDDFNLHTAWHVIEAKELLLDFDDLSHEFNEIKEDVDSYAQAEFFWHNDQKVFARPNINGG